MFCHLHGREVTSEPPKKGRRLTQVLVDQTHYIECKIKARLHKDRVLSQLTLVPIAACLL